MFKIQPDALSRDQIRQFVIETIIFVLTAGWVFCLVSGFTFNGLIHVLFVLAALIAIVAVDCGWIRRGETGDRKFKAAPRIEFDR